MDNDRAKVGQDQVPAIQAVVIRVAVIPVVVIQAVVTRVVVIQEAVTQEEVIQAVVIPEDLIDLEEGIIPVVREAIIILEQIDQDLDHTPVIPMLDRMRFIQMMADSHLDL